MTWIKRIFHRTPPPHLQSIAFQVPFNPVGFWMVRAHMREATK